MGGNDPASGSVGGCTSCGGGSAGGISAGGGSQHGFSLAVSRGYDSGGGLAGNVGFSSLTPSASIFTPAALVWKQSATSEARYSGGALAQLLDPQGLVDVQVASTNLYRLRFFTRGQIATTNGALVTLTNGAAPHTVWTVENPNGGTTNFNAVRITMTNSAGAFRQYDARYSLNAAAGLPGWIMESPGDLFESVVVDGTEATTIDGVPVTLRTERQSWRPVGLTNEVQVVLRKLRQYNWGEGLIEEVFGSGTDQRTNRFTYRPEESASAFGIPRENSLYWDGTWERLEYDANGRVTEIYSGHEIGDAENWNTFRRRSLRYAPVVAADTGTYGADRVRTETEYIGSAAVRKVIHAYLANEHRQIVCVSPAAAYNASGNLTTITHYVTSGANQGKKDRVIHPDGTVTLFGYGGTVNQRLETTASGQPDGLTTSATRVLNGTLNQATFGAYGELLTNATYNLNAGATNPLVAREIHSLPDELNRPRQVTYLDGTYTTRTFGCCGVTAATDRDGVVTEYFYDTALRPTASRRLGITLTNVLDVAGRVVTQRRIGTDSTTITLSSRGYDTAGLLRYETNALGGVTQFAETRDADNRRVRTTTLPGGGTRIETYNRDGSLYRLTGTAVQPRQVTTYGTDVQGDYSGATWISCAARSERPLDAAGNYTSEETITYTDSRGFQFRRDEAGSPVRWWAYNTLGQLAAERDGDGVTTLYTYNAQGDLASSGVDYEADGVLSAASSDRIRLTTRYCTNVSGVDYRYSAQQEYSTAGSTTLVTVQEHWETLSGLSTWDVAFGLTNRTVTTINPGTQTRTVTRYAPDGSSVVEVYLAGRLSTSTSLGSTGSQVAKTTLGYDAHGRRAQSTDARNGTTIFGYNSADLVTTVTSPQPGTGAGAQTVTTGYDTLGRVTTVVQPDGTSMTNTYWLTGELRKVTGSRVYPVEYTYDTVGRMATMTTWRNFVGNSGAAVTTWLYDDRGRLQYKRYDDASEVSYQYTPGSRLKYRTWARSLYTTYEYDFEDTVTARKTGDLVRVSYSDGVTPQVGYAYDRRGRRTGIEQRDGSSTLIGASTLGYHASGVLTSETHTTGPLSGLSLTLGYDGSLRRTNLTAKQSSTTVLLNRYGYDTASRLNLVGNGTSDVSYTYAANSFLADTVTFKQSGTTRLTTTRQYDFLNRLQSTWAQPGAAGTAPIGSAYQYNDANQRTRQQLGDASYWRYEYDALGQVVSGRRYWSDGSPVLGQQFEYGFDDIGNRKTAKTGGDANGANLRSQNYTANNLNLYTTQTNPRYLEVQGAAQASATVTVNSTSVSRQGEYFRKELGPSSGTTAKWEPVTVSVSGGSTTGTKYLAVPPSTVSSGYDADGNLLSDGLWTYAWDGENRLIEAASALDPNTAAPYTPTSLARRITYRYDGVGRLIERVEYPWTAGAWSGTPSATTRYLNDGWQCVAEFSFSGSTLTHLRSYVWGLDVSQSRTGAGGVGGLVAIYQGGAAYFPAYDGNGNVSALVKGADGTVNGRYEYGPFGETLRATGDAVAMANPWRFSTKRADAVTGLVHYEYRVYSTSNGKWLGRDPIAEEGGMNCYGYVNNSPLDNVDALGLKPAKACTIGGQAVNFTFDGKTLNGSGLNLNAASGRPISERTTGHWKIDMGPGEGWVEGDEITKVFDYSYSRQGIRNVGPIPTGAYWFEVCEERSFWGGSLLQHGLGAGAWGSYSWSLHPDEGTDTRGRGGFFIHGGTSAGSAGCIDIGYGDNILHSLMEDVREECGCCYVSVSIAYTVSERSITERIQTWSGTHLPIRP